MSSKADLVFLEQKLSAATGPDRELDALLVEVAREALSQQKLGYGAVWRDQHPHFTASLDTVIALVERVRPGWYWQVQTIAGHCLGAVWTDAGLSFDASAKTPALALCLALVRSLQKENGNS